MRSIKISLTPSEAQDFRWFLERCLEIGPELKNSLGTIVRLDTVLDTVFTNENIVHKRTLFVPLMVITELCARLLPKLYFIGLNKKPLKITLKASEALAVDFIIQNRPKAYLIEDSAFSNVKIIWLLQVGKYL
jgi:hypothetical protein